MIIDQEFLDRLSVAASLSPRKRVHFDLRDSAEEGSMRMLNAIEPGAVIPIHRHLETSEEVIILRGEVEEFFYNPQGEETARFHLVAGGDAVAVHVPIGQYHTCRSLQPGSVIMEFKNGRYDPQTTEDLLG